MEEELCEFQALEELRVLRGWEHDDPKYKTRATLLGKKYMAVARVAAKPAASAPEHWASRVEGYVEGTSRVRRGVDVEG